MKRKQFIESITMRLTLHIPDLGEIKNHENLNDEELAGFALMEAQASIYCEPSSPLTLIGKHYALCAEHQLPEGRLAPMVIVQVLSRIAFAQSIKQEVAANDEIIGSNTHLEDLQAECSVKSDLSNLGGELEFDEEYGRIYVRLYLNGMKMELLRHIAAEGTGMQIKLCERWAGNPDEPFKQERMSLHGIRRLWDIDHTTARTPKGKIKRLLITSFQMERIKESRYPKRVGLIGTLLKRNFR